MRALLQRVSEAKVSVDGELVGAIDRGLLVLLGVERNDSEAIADRMVDKLLAYRVFADAEGKMNRSLVDIGGGLLLVSQFTLAADTRKGTRPGFSSAAEPARAAELYHYMCGQFEGRCDPFASGRFGADMQVQLTNDGPVTFLLQTS